MIIYIQRYDANALDCMLLSTSVIATSESVADSNGLIKLRHIHRCRNDDNPSYVKSFSWKIEVHVLSHASVKSAASFGLSKSRRIAFSIRLMDTAGF